MDRFHRRIDRTDAEDYKIRKFLQDLPIGNSCADFYNNNKDNFYSANYIKMIKCALHVDKKIKIKNDNT